MRVERKREKPYRGESKNQVWWYVSHYWFDQDTQHTYRVTGAGRSLAEAKKELKCQKLHCNPTHMKQHQPLEVWTL